MTDIKPTTTPMRSVVETIANIPCNDPRCTEERPCPTHIARAALEADRGAHSEPTCNLCGLSCVLGPVDSPARDACGLIDAVVSGGYESTPGNGSGALDDCTAYRFSLCEFCLDWLFKQFRVPVRVADAMSRAEDEPMAAWMPAAERVATQPWRKQKAAFFDEWNRRNEARRRKP